MFGKWSFWGSAGGMVGEVVEVGTGVPSKSVTLLKFVDNEAIGDPITSFKLALDPPSTRDMAGFVNGLELMVGSGRGVGRWGCCCGCAVDDDSPITSINEVGLELIEDAESPTGLPPG